MAPSFHMSMRSTTGPDHAHPHKLYYYFPEAWEHLLSHIFVANNIEIAYTNFYTFPSVIVISHAFYFLGSGFAFQRHIS